MELLGIGLGLLTALLWGTADAIATMAARRWKTFKITIVSQSAGFLGLGACGIVAFVFLGLPLTQTAVALSLLIGIFTGIVAAFGYFYCYRALEAGPIALVSPLTSTSAVCTLLLSLFVLRQDLTAVQIGAVVLCILGVLLASTNPRAIRAVVKTSGSAFFTPGVRWALVATLAFGVMDFGIGASAAISGWFLPVLWTRIFSICALTLISFWKRRQRLKRAQLAEAALPQAEMAAVPSALSAEYPHVAGQQRAEGRLQIASSMPEWSGASSLASLGDLEALDPDATLISRPSRGDRSLAALDPESTLLRLRVFPIESPVPVRRSSTLNLLEASLRDSLNLQPVRSFSPYLIHTDDTNRLYQHDLGHPGSNGPPQDIAAFTQSPAPAQEAPASGPPQRSPSLALPSLAELSQFRMPRASKLGMGVLLAIITGITESAAILCFSIDTRLATTGVAAAIASGYSLIVILFGLTFYRERLAWNQIGGITVFLSALIFLAFV